jgi:hypothetical protein
VIDDEAIELGARAVACKGWRWLPGMRAMGWSDDLVAVRVYHPQTASRSPLVIHHGGNRWDMSMHGPYLPDLRDPCTLGGLLALVREAKDDPCWQVLCLGDDAWSIESGDYPHEAAALVAALEAGSVRDLDWYLDEQTRETGERWPAACECFVNLDPDEYPDQPGCDRCGHGKGAHR